MLIRTSLLEICYLKRAAGGVGQALASTFIFLIKQKATRQFSFCLHGEEGTHVGTQISLMAIAAAPGKNPHQGGVGAAKKRKPERRTWVPCDRDHWLPNRVKCSE